MGVIISWLNSAVANVLFLTERFWLVFALLHKSFYKEQTKTMFKMFSKISFQKISCIVSPVLCANRFTTVSGGEIFEVTLNHVKGWLAIAKLKPLSLFISLLFMLRKAFDYVR